ncbi:hypothetical protein AB751O23_AE_00200 [Chlamydiales bacterium SCGC AB-751-O23]|nr:hypothetical protein AB751O23_AE_00200 [Chlamydiales bacterium SCGC AB-751-O23]
MFCTCVNMIFSLKDNFTIVKLNKLTNLKNVVIKNDTSRVLRTCLFIRKKEIKRNFKQKKEGKTL